MQKIIVADQVHTSLGLNKLVSIIVPTFQISEKLFESYAQNV